MVKPLISREQFIQQYTYRSKVSLVELGREAYPCACDYEGCEGWQMSTKKWMQDYTEMGGFINLEDYIDWLEQERDRLREEKDV